jgi:hypothetical protein
MYQVTATARSDVSLTMTMKVSWFSLKSVSLRALSHIMILLCFCYSGSDCIYRRFHGLPQGWEPIQRRTGCHASLVLSSVWSMQGMDGSWCTTFLLVRHDLPFSIWNQDWIGRIHVYLTLSVTTSHCSIKVSSKHTASSIYPICKSFVLNSLPFSITHSPV